MKIPFYLSNRTIRNEEPASKHINVLTHYNDDTLMDKSGKLIKIIKLSGIDFVTQDESALDRFKFRRNNLLKNISSEFAFYFWEVRRKFSPYLSGNFNDGFAKTLNDAYQKKLSESSMFHTEFYFGIITKQPEGLIRKSLSFFRMLNFSIDKYINYLNILFILIYLSF